MRTFLILGQTGVGKSSFINAAFGIPFAKTDEFRSCTKVVKHYANGTLFGDVCLIDTPGLSEDNEDLDGKYLEMIRDYMMFDQVDVVLYVTPLTETRCRSSERRTLLFISQELGYQIWEDAWLIFTFAASIPYEKLDQTCEKRHNQLIKFLREISPEEYPFKGFSQVALVDNVISDWTPEGIPIAQLLVEA
jgi:GTPase Era involved in 16S rRNA processing